MYDRITHPAPNPAGVPQVGNAGNSTDEIAAGSPAPLALSDSAPHDAQNNKTLVPDVAVAVGNENLFFSHLQKETEWQKAHPDVQIMTDEQSELLSADQIPSNARMRFAYPNTPVHLTARAATERLKVLMLTHPRFAATPGIATQQILERPITPIMAEANTRVPVDAQTAIAELETMGFTFIERDGAIVMLVDSVIPVSENTDGRIHFTPIGTYRNAKYADPLNGTPYMEFQVNAALPSRPQKTGETMKTGVRGVTHTTQSAVAIPVERILQNHRQTPGVAVGYSTRAEADEWGLPHIIENHQGHTIALILHRALSNLRSDPSLQPVFERRGAGNQPQLIRKQALFRFLTDAAGLKPTSNPHSYFPKEPVFYLYGDRFDGALRDQQRMSTLGLDDLRALGEMAPGQSSSFPRAFYLEDILTAVDTWYAPQANNALTDKK